jgi:hypothetical protein
MHTSTINLFYTHNELPHVSANHVVILRDMKCKRQIHQIYKM